jgi:hypothetical protein
VCRSHFLMNFEEVGKYRSYGRIPGRYSLHSTCIHSLHCTRVSDRRRAPTDVRTPACDRVTAARLPPLLISSERGRRVMRLCGSRNANPVQFDFVNIKLFFLLLQFEILEVCVALVLHHLFSSIVHAMCDVNTACAPSGLTRICFDYYHLV